MSFKYDIFLSHSSQNKPTARLIALELRHAGFNIWFDEWALNIGDDIYSAIEQAIEASQSMMLLMSQAFFLSEWGTMERNTAAFRDPTNLRRPLLPVLIERCEAPNSLRRLSHYDMLELSPPRFNNLITTVGMRLGLPGRARTQFLDKVLAEQIPQHAAATSTAMAKVYERLVLASMNSKASTLLFVDLDGFSYINAKYGIPIGEKILSQVSEILSNALPHGAFAARWRADEFAIFIPNLFERDALPIATIFVESVARFHWEDIAKGLYVSISCGVSGRKKKTKDSPAEMDVEWIERAILGTKAAKLRGGAKARIGERLFTSDGERIRKSMNPLAYLAGYGS